MAYKVNFKAFFSADDFVSFLNQHIDPDTGQLDITIIHIFDRHLDGGITIIYIENA
jgi:hypothetical protein